ncbi:MAG: right-handed parallel beta-helix repeat-containing protein [Planctomycetales bacterium]|nr:right-handed parallel beta-helix repeat-containing protein [Planctomycetales bacterium]
MSITQLQRLVQAFTNPIPCLFAAQRFGILMLLCLGTAAATGNEPLAIKSDTKLDPNRTYGPIVIEASDLVLDGQGATIEPGELMPVNQRRGVGIDARGVSNVIIKNVRVRGWEIGLQVVDGQRWQVLDCDFSDNFHDPTFGWGENGRRGGVVWGNVSDSIITRCVAKRNWDACTLIGSHRNLVESNDFSETSNTCLKLWNACDNRVLDNKLRYGIRMDPGEVHARDSTCVLIESGSNRNRFLRNDCRYGGDGIFIRVLNQWVSEENYFEENDCSYANNNCVEAWAPRNVWVRNKANHGSYGFWLGASEGNVLIDNEASFNGLPDGNHNSPHLPQQSHAGIVFMFGPSRHTVLRGNLCEGNQGAGIAAIGDARLDAAERNAFHWIVERNRLLDNRWGIYLQNAEFVDLAANEFSGNSIADTLDAGNVVALRQHAADDAILLPPYARLNGPQVVRAGENVDFDAVSSRDPQGRPLTFYWSMQSALPLQSIELGQQPTPAELRHTFDRPGFYRLALTVNNGVFSDMAFRDIYAIRNVTEAIPEDDTSGWSCVEVDSTVRFAAIDDGALVGRRFLRADINPYSGNRVTLRLSLSASVSEASDDALPPRYLSFWMRARNENIPAWQDLNPIVSLESAAAEPLTLTPKRDLLSNPPYSEGRGGWIYYQVPLAGDDLWQRSGELNGHIQALRFSFDSWGAPPLQIDIDGLTVE